MKTSSFEHAKSRPAPRGSVLIAALFASLSMAALPGCVAASEDPPGIARSYGDDARAWQRESERWMADFREMAPDFPRELPQLRPDSAFNRHSAALQAFVRDLEGQSPDPRQMQSPHAELQRAHDELRAAYRNMLELAERRSETPNLRPSPEIAEDTPQRAPGNDR